LGNNESILKLTNISFGYNNNQKVLDNLNLNITSNEIVGVLGPNGAGKTTLFLTITGVKKPEFGKVILMDKEVKNGKFRPEIGMVFQDANDQLFCPTVYDDISFGLNNMGLTNEEINFRVEKALKTLGILELKNQPPHHLSGGQKRLVAIAGVLAMDSSFILYDEPTSNLDIRYRRKLINFIRSSNAKAMLIASHDLEFILEVCTRVIILDNGKIVADGNPTDIMKDNQLMESHGLEVPYSLKYS